MTLVINGEKKEIESVTLNSLIIELGVVNQVMAAAVNMEIVKKADWVGYELKEGDSVELLRFVGGG